MARHLGLGPVFAFEWLMASRRWQAYALRSVTVLLFLAGMLLIWAESPYARSWDQADVSIQQQAEIGRSFFTSTSMILLGLIGLVAPAATAGSICLDKARGNLTLLFASDLRSDEIVLGKLAARMVPVLGLILSAAPVMAIGTLFGGIDPMDLIGTIFVMLGVAFFGCSLAMMLSVWGRKTHEVLMLTYVILIIFLLSPMISWGIMEVLGSQRFEMSAIFQVLVMLNPVFLIMATIEPPPGNWQVTLVTKLIFLGVGLAASACFLGVSIWRIRPVVIEQFGRAEKARRRSIRRRLASLTESDRFTRVAPGTANLIRGLRRIWPAPSLDRNPVFWRECQRTSPSRLSLVSWSLYILLCGGFSVYAIVLMWIGRREGYSIGIFMNTVQVPLGLLLLSVSAATSLSEERQRGSLDVLLASPMTTRAIVWGKWRGTFRSVPPLLILPTAITIGMAFSTGRFLAIPIFMGLIISYGAAITSLGLAMATWFSRVGRAAGSTTGAYVFMCVAWPILAILLFSSGDRKFGVGVATGSPFVGIGVYSALIGESSPSDDFAAQTFWTLIWTIGYLGAAAGLLLMTVTSFDRFLGRIDDLSSLTPWDRERPDKLLFPRLHEVPNPVTIADPAAESTGPG